MKFSKKLWVASWTPQKAERALVVIVRSCMRSRVEALSPSFERIIEGGPWTVKVFPASCKHTCVTLPPSNTGMRLVCRGLAGMLRHTLAFERKQALWKERSIGTIGPFPGSPDQDWRMAFHACEISQVNQDFSFCRAWFSGRKRRRL